MSALQVAESQGTTQIWVPVLYRGEMKKWGAIP